MSNLNDIFFTPAANQELTYDQVLEDVQRYFAENHASTIAEAGEGNGFPELLVVTCTGPNLAEIKKNSQLCTNGQNQLFLEFLHRAVQ